MNAAIRRDLSSALDPFAEILAQAETIASHPALSGRRRAAVPMFDDILSQAPEFHGDSEPLRPAMMVAPALPHAAPLESARSNLSESRVSHSEGAATAASRSAVADSPASRPAVARQARPAVPVERVEDQRPLPTVVKVDPAGKSQPVVNSNASDSNAGKEGCAPSTPLTEAQVELMRALDEFDYDD